MQASFPDIIYGRKVALDLIVDCPVRRCLELGLTSVM